MSGESRMPKKKNRFYRWLAMALTVALLAGQSHVFVLAEEGDVPPTEVSDETTVSVSDNDNTGDTDNDTDEDDENTGDSNDKDIEDDTDVNDIEVNEEDEPQEDVDERDRCICVIKCEEDCVYMGCIVCYADYSACAVEDTAKRFFYKGIKYVVTGDGEAGVYRQGANAVSGDIIIPETVEDLEGNRYQVTSLGLRAFHSCSSLTSVEIPESVTSIGSLAFFSCSSLTDVEIPEGVTRIENETFCECHNLTSVTIPEGVTYIGYGAFHLCTSLTSAAIPKSVTSIDGFAFQSCHSLTNVEIPEGVTSIGVNAFSACRSLTSVKIPKSLTSIAVAAFAGCNRLTSVTISENVTFISSYVFSQCEGLEELRIAIPSDGKFQFPEVGTDTFSDTPDERYIHFVDETGKDLTGDALKNAKTVFTEAAKDDTDSDDSTWYGWSLWEPSGEVDTYTVTINVKKDGNPWSSHGRTFALLKSGGGFINVPGQISDSAYSITQVPNGTYSIYDITGVPADSLYSKAVDTGIDVRVSGMDTTVTVTVDGADAEKDVNYYTATFYDGTEAYKADTPQEPQIVLSGQRVAKPEDPSKADWQFAGWKTADGGNTPYDFESAVTNTIGIFASWIETTAEQLHITVTATEGGTIDPIGDITVTKGGEQTFMITPNEGNRIKAVTVDGSDVTAGLADTSARAQAGARYYTFTNVTENHTIHAAFESDGSTSGDDGGDKPNPDGGDNDNSGGGGDNSGGGGSDDGGNDDGGDSGSSDLDSCDSTEDIQMTVVSEMSPAPAGDGATDKADTAQVSGGQTANGKEPKTGDASHAEIYATVAMIAGLTYLLLYFMEEGRGMSEREKEVFVAAFIRWAKKGGAFRRCCAIAAIFCLLVYYHSVGKREGKNALDEKYLGQVL